MNRPLRAWLRGELPLDLPGDRRARRAYFTTAILTLMSLGVTAALLVVTLGWLSGHLGPTDVTLALLAAGLIYLATWLGQRGRAGLAALLPTLAFIGLGVRGACLPEAPSGMTLFYGLAVVLAGVLGSRRFLWSITLLALGAHVAAGLLLRPAAPDAVLRSVATVTLALAAFAVTIDFYASLLQTSLERLQHTGAELRTSEDLLRTLVNSQGEGITLLDLSWNFRFVNPAAEQILGMAPGTLLGANARAFLAPETSDALAAPFQHLQEGFKASFEVAVVTPSGARRFLLATATPQFNEARRLSGVFLVFRDNTERRRMEDSLRFLSSHDAMTGLHNRAYFEAELERLRQARIEPVAVLVADVDGLKVVNDSLGHAAGDRLLRRVADILRGAFRAQDVVARLGGDEFAALLPGLDAVAAAQAVARLQKALRQGGLQVSIGWAVTSPGMDLEAAQLLADNRMYAAKKRAKDGGAAA
jgi:diguanylate cyclase (GGDEF)-like protein/PAS domain S-box-containing protein